MEIEQRGSDVFARLLDPAGGMLVEVDSHTGSQGAEHLYHVAGERGSYTLAVRAFPGNPGPGAYLARIAAERPAGARDRRRAAAEKTFADAYARAESASLTSPPEAAVAGYRRAAAMFERLGENRRQADALYEQATLLYRAGRHREAIAAFERCLSLLTRPADRRDRAITLNELALAWREAGDPDHERRYLEQALAAFQKLEDRRNESVVSSNLGRLEGRRGRPLEALDLLRRAAGRWRELDERLELVTTLNLIGEVYLSIGEVELALDHHRQALALLDPRAEPLKRANTLSFIGLALFRAGDLSGAAEAYRETLELRRAGDDEAGIANALNGLGLVEVRSGNPRRALELYRRALAVFERRGGLLDRAVVINNLAWLHFRLGEAEQAVVLHEQALGLFRRLQNQEGKATSLLGLARARRLLRDNARALDSAEAALAAIERVLEAGQAPAVRSDLRLPYLASRQDYYDLYIELLMEEHRRRPAAGFDALALATAEQARARHLLETLGKAPGAMSRKPEPGLLERQRALREEINAADLELRRRRSISPVAETAAAERRQRLRLAEYHRLAQRIHAQSPWSAALNPPRPLAVEEIQRLLTDGTLLLEVHLGQEESFLWAVTHDTLTSHRLPPREELESLARRAYELLIESDRVTHRVPAERALAELARVLLGPVAGRLAGQRLLVVTGGALEYIPFAALPLPGRERRRLVEEHEIVHLPSASVLAVLRRQAAEHPPPKGLLAVLADPVFGPEDDRLAGLDTAPREPEAGLPILSPLPHSRREAEAIVALAGDRGAVLPALGFEAHRELAVSGRLAGYRILHFATHGVLHPEHPELSALILSRYRPDGRPRDGRLPLYDLYALQLPADLVVLSACRTALGKEVRGEGLFGLPRGFFYAGASRVLVSLWSVADDSTAELMTRFYRHLLAEGRPPAAALAAAQRSMLTEPRYAPYHWAGFVLQGDWL